jgi:heat shock protein HtpX
VASLPPDMEWRTDWGLRARMLLTMLLLGGVYVFFGVALAVSLGAGPLVVLGLFGALSLVQLLYSDRLALWSMGAEEVSPEEYPDLHATVGRLAQQADLPKPTVAVVDSQVPNAFATGKSQDSAVVAVHTGLLETLDDDQVEAVVAHELAHIKNRDMQVMTIASFLSTLALIFVRWGWLFGGGGRRRGGGGGVIVAIGVSILVWIVSYLLIRALSRYREYAADRGAAIISGKPVALATALEAISGRMDNIPERDMREESEMNALFIIPERGVLSRLFSTHPPTEKRVDRLRELAREMEQEGV